MSNTQDTGDASGAPTVTAMLYEVTVLPVADVDRAKDFYQSLGWRLDGDFPIDEGYRVVQFTPPASAASIQFGKGLTTLAPGSMQDMLLAVEDLDAMRAELASRGIEASEIWHGRRGPGTAGREPGRDPEDRSYFSFVSFADPDGNRWVVQEVTERLPGRLWQSDIPDRAALLRETEHRHGEFEAAAPPHAWSDWYAAYLDARERGIDPDDAAAAAARYMAQAKHVVVTSP